MHYEAAMHFKGRQERCHVISPDFATACNALVRVCNALFQCNAMAAEKVQGVM